MKKKTVFIGILFSFLLVVKKLITFSGSALIMTSLIFAIPESAYADTAVFYYNQGIDKFKKGYFYGAIHDFTKAIEIDPNDFEAYVNRGMAKINLDLTESAIIDFNKAIEIDPKFYPAYLKRGFAKRLLKDYLGAIEDYNKVIEINPKNSNAYAGRGDAKLGLGDMKGHCTDYKIAASLGEDATDPKHQEIMQDMVENGVFKYFCDKEN